MEEMMICPTCEKSELHEARENIRYIEGGLPDVTLCNILVERCPECGETLVTIPKMSELHRTLAIAIARKQARLSSNEIQFLRKSMGWSKVDLAAKMRIGATQINRWESGQQQMSPQSEILLRIFILHGQRRDDYLDDIQELPLNDEAPPYFPVQFQDGHWEPLAA
jgi:putative zinc finger/helix-turn-helix YgiT family protein